ncbi:LysR family transcriptional regulator [Duganella sp. FT50W]|uniref:LysR family transcriptional regulator n=1 Tax=Duganella lactea TaxID=2692173 RepID=A0A6L8MJQ7_9BURK|nr:LysR family transcriptional regulator [Duganella lactea]MYM34528.1 LysR family transcriptional regulator [Duganella lactea]MYM83390.1 LysR family transcriptional regulator [Duganella lactea]
MRFNKLDLNLLVALNALLTERNISRAAEKLYLSQPATSGALSRLRAYFNDELLVPSGRQLMLTQRAKELVDPVREVLMRIDTTIAAQPQFDPATESRVFTLLVSDYTSTVLIPTLLAELYREAPNLRIRLRNQAERPDEVLEQGEADFLVIPSQYLAKDHPSAALFEEDYLCVTWEGNSRVKERLTFDDYLACGHVIATFEHTNPLSTFDGWFMESFDVKRRVEVTAPTLSALPSMVIGTDRIATVHRRIALRAQATLPIKVWEPPPRIPRLVQMLQWHKHRSNDPAIRWIRDKIVTAAAGV